MLLINRNLMNTRILLIVFLSFYFGQNISAKGYVFNITDYGAKGDGITLDTKAIQSAINDAAENGGRVVIPGGKYLSGTIFMRSNVTIDLTEGAVLPNRMRNPSGYSTLKIIRILSPHLNLIMMFF